MKTVGRMGGSQFSAKRAETATVNDTTERRSSSQQSIHITNITPQPRSVVVYETAYPPPAFHMISSPYILDMYSINLPVIIISALIYILWSNMRRP